MRDFGARDGDGLDRAVHALILLFNIKAFCLYFCAFVQIYWAEDSRGYVRDQGQRRAECDRIGRRYEVDAHKNTLRR